MESFRSRSYTPPRPRRKDPRPYASERGYTPEYRDARVQVLAEERTCGVCGKPGQESDVVDHITPLSQGGTSRRSNLRRVCRPCNTWLYHQSFKANIRTKEPDVRKNGVMV